MICLPFNSMRVSPGFLISPMATKWALIFRISYSGQVKCVTRCKLKCCRCEEYGHLELDFYIRDQRATSVSVGFSLTLFTRHKQWKNLRDFSFEEMSFFSSAGQRIFANVDWGGAWNFGHSCLRDRWTKLRYHWNSAGNPPQRGFVSMGLYSEANIIGLGWNSKSVWWSCFLRFYPNALVLSIYLSVFAYINTSLIK